MHVHFIGICGVGMSGIAVAFKKAGWKVTGSDVGFFPPVSTRLKSAGVAFYPGWHPERMDSPDLVVVGNVAGSQNPEWLAAQEKKLRYKSYPEVLAEYFVKQNSIVCAGTCGKTTIAALLSWILTQANFAPSYMFGGLAISGFESASMGSLAPQPPAGDYGASGKKEGWSVIEGDEYKSARWDARPKFSHYSPTHLLLASISWDHADIYPTAESYFDAFENLIASIPKHGLIVACADDEKVLSVIASAAKQSPTNNTYGIASAANGLAMTITYGKAERCDYQYGKISQSGSGIKFELRHGKKIYKVSSPMLGEFMAQNLCGVFALASAIGIAPEKILSAIKTFDGLKRRLEKRGQASGADVYDDIAHSPAKAKSTLATLRQIYKGKIYAVFEPNTGGRSAASAPSYAHAFANANEVIVPALTKLKLPPLHYHTKNFGVVVNLPLIKGETTNELMNGAKLAKIISKTHNNAKFMPDDDALVAYLKKTAQKEDTIVFLGSRGFRGMIDRLISPRQPPQQ
ncbi:hypothetical protein EPN28_04635 [Patescibacteria group bacterium]|nr:MAG: hypothetical protein EPN28_04635 [Patescibacteria group bacterium]